MKIRSEEKWIKVFAPASVANVGPGFDIFGFALENIGDVVEARKTKEKGVIISEITGDGGLLSRESNKNVVSYSAQLVLQKINASQGVEFKLHKGMPIGTGMGSSGASVTAGAFAANALFGSPLSKKELLPIIALGEQSADGGYHVDNSGPSLFGGFTLIRSYNPVIDLISIPVPKNLLCVIVRPDFKLLTKRARAVIPKNIPLSLVIQQMGNSTALIAALFLEDYELLKRSIDDRIVERARAALIPGFLDVKKAALSYGALGCSISGSGPSVFAFTKTEAQGRKIANAMKKAFKMHGLKSEIFISKINTEGARIIS